MASRLLLHVPAVVLSLACAPVSSFRPAAGLMPEATRQFGIGGTVVTPRRYVLEPAHGVGHIWFGSRLGGRSDLTALVAFDDEGLALGAAVGVRYLESARVVAAVEGELGYAWCAISLPLSIRLFDQTQLYASPRLGTWGTEPIFGIPVGLSVHVYGGLSVRGEWQRSWQNFQYYNRRDHFGAAVAYDF